MFSTDSVEETVALSFFPEPEEKANPTIIGRTSAQAMALPMYTFFLDVFGNDRVKFFIFWNLF